MVLFCCDMSCAHVSCQNEFGMEKPDKSAQRSHVWDEFESQMGAMTLRALRMEANPYMF